jgi:hypothetical protein
VLKPGGYFICVDPDPKSGTPGTIERDTFTCQHCNKIVRVTPMCPPEDMGGRCMQCGEGLGGLICKECATKGNCVPLEKAITQMEDRSRFLREVFGVD